MRLLHQSRAAEAYVRVLVEYQSAIAVGLRPHSLCDKLRQAISPTVCVTVKTGENVAASWLSTTMLRIARMPVIRRWTV
jgi:hypothetical protein